MVDTADEITAPVKDTVEPVVGTVKGTTEPVLKPVQDTVEPIVKPAQQTVEPVVDAVGGTAKPVLDRVDPIVQPVKDTVDPVVEPVVDPVKETIDPVIKPVPETVNPVIDPVKDPDDPPAPPAEDPGVPGVKPLQETTDPGGPGVVATTHQPDKLPDRRPDPTDRRATIEALRGPAQQMAEPAVGATLDPVPRAEVSAGDAPVLKEGVVRAGEDISLGASSGSVAPMLSAQAPAGTVVAKTQRSLTPSIFSVGVPTGEYASILDYFTTTVRGAQDVLPRPSPFSGAIPASATGGSSSSGLGASSGGLSFGLGALAVLLMLCVLHGRLLLFLHDCLRPNSALVLALERPG